MQSTTQFPIPRRALRGRVLVAGALALVAAAVPAGRSFAAGTEDDPPTTVAGSATPVKPASGGGTAAKPAGGAAVVAVATKGAGDYYESGKANIIKSDWATAIVDLEQADKLQPNNADVNNLLGYSNRKLGKLDISLSYYRKALKLTPKHLGANEYLGELYLMMNQPAKAKIQLATLAKICGKTCEQYLDLKKGIDSYKAPAKKK